MKLIMEIICENFEQVKSKNNEIIVSESTEEYYLIPLNKSYTMESDNEIFKLTFTNQLLWLKYSNHKKIIHFKEDEFLFNEYVLIKSDEILDVYVKLDTTRYFKKNVWQSKYNVFMNKKYLNKYFLILPIIDNMINIKEYGEGIVNYNIELITNEILLKQVLSRYNNHGNIIVDNNILLNKEALFVEVYDNEVDLFLEEN